jgi:hypothetical protein
MNGELPEIFWYLFWIGFVILAFRMAYLGGKSGYETKMKALDILKMYAEKGAEPPPAVMEELTRQAFEHNTPSKKGDAKGTLFGGFIGFLFTACAAWALRTWLISIDAPSWSSIAATGAWAFFGFGAFGFLLAALITRQK